MTELLALQPVWVVLLIALTLLVFALPLLPAVLASRATKNLGAMFIDGDDDGSAAYAASSHAAALREQGALGGGPGEKNAGVFPWNGSGEPGLRVEYGPDADIAHPLSAENIHVKRGTHLRSVASAKRLLYMEEGCSFSWLDAPCICFGHGVWRIAPWNARRATLKLFSPYSGERFERFEGDQIIEAGKVVTGDRLVTGDLTVGEGCTLVGSVKVYGHVQLGARSSIKGSVFAEKSVLLGVQCFVSGVVSANDLVQLGVDSVIGTMEQLSSVSARRVQAAPGAVVHGSVRARETGNFPVSGSSA